MNEFFEVAFSTHTNIKNRLRKAILGKCSIDPETVRSAHLCEVGQWIEGEGTDLHDRLPEFQEMKEAHALFHQSAFDALLLYRQGDIEAARHSIEHGSFQKASEQLIISIQKLKKQVQVKFPIIL